MSEPAKPGILDRLRARYGWFDHIMRAYGRFDGRNGGFYAAGLTYYTIFALFPLLMVGFAVMGFMLHNRPDLLNAIDNRIRSSVTMAVAEQMVGLMNQAIEARASVGLIGLATAAWAGLGWMSHLRVALTEMWWEHRINSAGFLRTKLSDLLAMIGTFVVIVATLALTALGQARPMAALLRWIGVPDFSLLGGILRLASIVVSMLVSWLLFTWMIAKLPRQKVNFADSVRAGLMATVGFEAFKQVGSVYLQKVTASPAGSAFGPVLGLMVFAYVTSFLVLFAAAWAATTSVDTRAQSVFAPPEPVVISPRVYPDEGLSARQAAAAAIAGAVGALALSRLYRGPTRR